MYSEKCYTNTFELNWIYI